MKNNILEFDKRTVDISEIQEHIKFYIDKSDEVFTILSNGNKKAAMDLFKEVRKIMKLEFDYYNKSKIQNIIYSNNNYNSYYSAIYEGFAKQTRPNSYDMLSSNLDDIQSYMRCYCSDLLE